MKLSLLIAVLGLGAISSCDPFLSGRCEILKDELIDLEICLHNFRCTFTVDDLTRYRLISEAMKVQCPVKS